MTGLRPLSLKEIKDTVAYKALDEAEQKAVDTLYEKAKGLDGDDQTLSKEDVSRWVSAHAADRASKAFKLVSAELDKMDPGTVGLREAASKVFTSFEAMLKPIALRRGDSGENVEFVQKLLKEQGFYSGEVDGKYGPGTQSAVRAFQQQNRLTVDGVVGPATHMKLAGLGGILNR